MGCMSSLFNITKVLIIGMSSLKNVPWSRNELKNRLKRDNLIVSNLKKFKGSQVFWMRLGAARLAT